MGNHGGLPNDATAGRMAAAGARGAPGAAQASHDGHTDGLTIGEETIDALHNLTGGIFAGSDEWTPEADDVSLDRATLAAFAGGGQGSGATVEASTVYDSHGNYGAVEFETLGPRDARGEYSWAQHMVIEPYNSSPAAEPSATLEDANGDTYEPSVRMDSVDWGDHSEHTAAGLAAFARTAYQSEQWGIERIDLGADTEQLWRTLGYDENPEVLEVGYPSADGIDALRGALDERHLPDPWAHR